jgi:hypothetical protein
MFYSLFSLLFPIWIIFQNKKLLFHNKKTELNNDLDLTLLTEAFGEKRKSFSFSDTNLNGWIADELSGDGEIAALNNILARL